LLLPKNCGVSGRIPAAPLLRRLWKLAVPRALTNRLDRGFRRTPLGPSRPSRPPNPCGRLLAGQWNYHILFPLNRSPSNPVQHSKNSSDSNLAPGDREIRNDKNFNLMAHFAFVAPLASGRRSFLLLGVQNKEDTGFNFPGPLLQSGPSRPPRPVTAARAAAGTGPNFPVQGPSTQWNSVPHYLRIPFLR